MGPDCPLKSRVHSSIDGAQSTFVPAIEVAHGQQNFRIGKMRHELGPIVAARPIDGGSIILKQRVPIVQRTFHTVEPQLVMAPVLRISSK